MKQLLRLGVFAIVCTSFSNGVEQRVPSLNEISRIDDPVLREVFASSQAENQRHLPDQPAPHLERQPPPGGYHSGDRYYGQGEVPIARPEPLGPSLPQPQQPQSGIDRLVDTGASAFANGASAFYRGATQVGQAFGIQPANYEVPLLNQAAQLFGK